MTKYYEFKPLNLGRWIVWSLFALILAVMPLLFTSSLSVTILSQMGIAIIACLSYNMLLGQGGMLSFGHAVYTGLGSFVAIHALNSISNGSLPLPVSLIPLVGGIAGLGFAVLFGWVTTRKSGTTFAMITLGLGELVFAMSLMIPEFFGGEGGVSSNRVIGKPFFGITFGPPLQVYYLIAVYTFLAVAAMYAFTRTPLGRMLNAVRDNPERVEFVGYNTQRVRYHAFIISGFFAGIAGGLGSSAVRDRHCRGGRCSALRGLPAVHLPGWCHVLLRAYHGRHPDGAGLCAAVRVHQGLAAVPGPDLPVHGDVCAGGHRQPDHDEPARGRFWQAAHGCG
jgi:branched-chain amino acid transport system permease protein